MGDSSPRVPLTSEAAKAGSPLTPNETDGRIDITQAVALAENMPGVTLVPPSDEGAASRALLTPPTHKQTHLRSGGSSVSAPPRKRQDKGKEWLIEPPSPVAGPSGCQREGPSPTIQIPPWHPPLLSILKHLSACPNSPSNEPLPPADWIYRSAIFTMAARGLNLNNPHNFAKLWQKLPRAAIL